VINALAYLAAAAGTEKKRLVRTTPSREKKFIFRLKRKYRFKISLFHFFALEDSFTHAIVLCDYTLRFATHGQVNRVIKRTVKMNVSMQLNIFFDFDLV
jgi:hypothetical protein